MDLYVILYVIPKKVFNIGIINIIFIDFLSLNRSEI